MAPGGRFIAALASHDFNGAQALLADNIDFKGCTASKAFFELKGARDVMALMHEWYDPPSAIEMLDTDRVVDRHHVSYASGGRTRPEPASSLNSTPSTIWSTDGSPNCSSSAPEIVH